MSSRSRQVIDTALGFAPPSSRSAFPGRRRARRRPAQRWYLAALLARPNARPPTEGADHGRTDDQVCPVHRACRADGSDRRRRTPTRARRRPQRPGNPDDRGTGRRRRVFRGVRPRGLRGARVDRLGVPGFSGDRFPPLVGTDDRILATSVTAWWRYGGNGSGGSAGLDVNASCAAVQAPRPLTGAATDDLPGRQGPRGSPRGGRGRDVMPREAARPGGSDVVRDGEARRSLSSPPTVPTA